MRQENLIPGTAMPFTSLIVSVYDSGDYRKCRDIARERIDVSAVRARQRKAKADAGSTWRICVGFANYLEMSAHGTRMFAAAGYPFVPGHEPTAVRFAPDGTLEIRIGVHSHGQGMETTIARIAPRLQASIHASSRSC